MASVTSSINSSSPIDPSSPIDSPAPINSCVQCQFSSSEPLMNGWKSRTGGYAQLCANCYSLYEAGLFCETFHMDEDGWRDCNSCKKLVHCGCIVSLSDYSLDDFGGIVCVECSVISSLQALNPASPGSNPQDLEPSPTVLQSVVTPLFEKSMTASDARFRNSRIVLPKIHAKAHFPQVSEGEVVPMSVLDTDGKEWDLFYRCWVHKHNTMYVLQGLKGFMKSKNLKAGDTVAFYRRESDQKIILELKKKTSPGTSSPQASTSRHVK